MNVETELVRLTKENDNFKKIIETILKPNGYQYAIIFAIQERKDKYNSFNEKQKVAMIKHIIQSYKYDFIL